MAVTTTAVVRVFSFSGVELPDPSSVMSTDDVRDLYSATYPELTTATIEGPEMRGNRMVYTFRRAAGTKG